MRTFFENDIEVIEYDFNDWTEGTLSTDWFKRSGDMVLLNSKTRVKIIYRISTLNYEKILDCAKEMFDDKVQKQFRFNQSYFMKTFQQSLDKTRLLEMEIERLEILFGIKEGNRKQKLYFQSSYSELYLKHKIKGEPFNYKKTFHPNFRINVGQDTPLLHFEADFLFWKWLLDEFTNKEKFSKQNPITAPIIKRFCELVNDSGYIPKKEHESAAKYCEKICKEFDLPYTANVRKYFSINTKFKENDISVMKVKEIIFPLISDNNARQTIELFINNTIKLYK